MNDTFSASPEQEPPLNVRVRGDVRLESSAISFRSYSSCSEIRISLGGENWS